MENDQERFEGYAIVEIMGHQRVAGYVTTVAFGSTVMFKVVQDEMPPEDRILGRDDLMGGRYVTAGSKVRVSRQRAETLIGSGSVYRMTRCTQEAASREQPVDVEVLEMAERKALPAVSTLRDYEDADDRADDDVPF